MPTRFTKGDLFAQQGLRGLAHGCNCAGAMGRGIAIEFRARFPKMYAEYRRRCADGRFAPGDVFAWREDDDLTIFNLATQKTWRTKATMTAVETSLRAMVAIAERDRISPLGLPRIAAGLGGLAWADVRALLTKIGDGTDVELIVFEEYEAAPDSRH
ncbi:macro domain-containing protein [Sandaracinus amylolyticus]|uniref:macro domain-containing protein n=1 Tax=Sandaracinus amylolyticus TaxID=927083 RepID=UPI001F4210CC|nr:macro domain-containing protein [Sandaracinus amylolyticus]UJR82508.1 Hypothetical protein I5071_45730 [Sandaracinus amylolyticus]